MFTRSKTLPGLIFWAAGAVFGSAFSAPAGAETITGTVVSVPAGDTLGIETETGPVKVRLAEVDAPDFRQPFYERARRFVESRALGKTVRVEVRMVDRYGRRVADVELPDGVRLNEAVVRAGYAWHYRVNHPPDRRLARLEYEAWRLSRGLWLQLDPRPPWEFRRERKVPDAPKKPAQADYDRIFHYGIVGDPRTQRFFWPACGPYPKGVRGFWIFRSRLDAETFGFRKAPGCPGE